MAIRNITIESHVPEIEDALAAVAEHECTPYEFDDSGDELEINQAGPERPYGEAFDGWFKYTVEDAGGEEHYSHYIELSDIPEAKRMEATAWLHEELAKQDLMVNTVATNPPRLHVMHSNWIRRRLPDHPELE